MFLYNDLQQLLQVDINADSEFINVAVQYYCMHSSTDIALIANRS